MAREGRDEQVDADDEQMDAPEVPRLAAESLRLLMPCHQCAALHGASYTQHGSMAEGAVTTAASLANRVVGIEAAQCSSMDAMQLAPQRRDTEA